MAGEFRSLGEHEAYRGSLITVAQARFAAPDGSEFERDVVHHPGAVSVVPVVAGGSVLLVRQFRAAIGRELLEIPAGKRDVDGEPPAETARRELIEEVGKRAGRLEKLAEFYNSPGFCDEHSYVFVALDLDDAPADAQGIEEQHMTVEEVALDDVPRLVATAEITDAKTIIGLTLAIEWLRRAT
ncbi:MAG TPA: NUDIX hydrolase [Acidimicrobiales bacterium]|nr:NUDIX hydrolase [Acidimicrobiales bacterium]